MMKLELGVSSNRGRERGTRVIFWSPGGLPTLRASLEPNPPPLPTVCSFAYEFCPHCGTLFPYSYLLCFNPLTQWFIRVTLLLMISWSLGSGRENYEMSIRQIFPFQQGPNPAPLWRQLSQWPLAHLWTKMHPLPSLCGPVLLKGALVSEVLFVEYWIYLM